MVYPNDSVSLQVLRNIRKVSPFIWYVKWWVKKIPDKITETLDGIYFRPRHFNHILLNNPYIYVNGEDIYTKYRKFIFQHSNLKT